MAAYESVSRSKISIIGKESYLDLKKAQLPPLTLPESEDDYDPQKHRNPSRAIGKWMAYFNMSRTMLGAGMLAIPLATSQAGLALGTFLNVATLLIIIKAHWTLLWCLNEISRQLRIPYISYRYGFRIALLHGPSWLHCIARKGSLLISILMLMSQLGICTVYVIFTVGCVRDVLDIESYNIAMAIIILPFLLLGYFMNTLRIVSYTSMLATALTFIGISIVLFQTVYYMKDHVKFKWASTNAIPIFFAIGSYLFNLSATGVILYLDRALRNPKILTTRTGVVAVGMGVPGLFSIIFGGFGYISLGAMDENILRSLPFDRAESMVAISFYCLAITLAYPLQAYPATQIVIEIIVERYDTRPDEKYLKLVEKLIRGIFIFITFLVAYVVPFQGSFVAFVGCLCTSILCLVFPALMHLSLLYPDQYGTYKHQLATDVFIIMIGLVCFLCGAVMCAYLLYIRILFMINSENKYM
ncbi:proton-coupled amino acid transporter-like protein CG1139 [Plutella xylostella]|uniref:proton-coupled amino acid transporter-like protein CG1139 n=1 Tax=Plutella xylostella TaxID=51655 RepID=UPI00203251AD|nr:proton-coupled amino acid transporter-like protein CG1139 [Plutella xylostella]